MVCEIALPTLAMFLTLFSTLQYWLMDRLNQWDDSWRICLAETMVFPIQRINRPQSVFPQTNPMIEGEFQGYHMLKNHWLRVMMVNWWMIVQNGFRIWFLQVSCFYQVVSRSLAISKIPPECPLHPMEPPMEEAKWRLRHRSTYRRKSWHRESPAPRKPGCLAMSGSYLRRFWLMLGAQNMLTECAWRFDHNLRIIWEFTLADTCPPLKFLEPTKRPCHTGAASDVRKLYCRWVRNKHLTISNAQISHLSMALSENGVGQYLDNRSPYITMFLHKVLAEKVWKGDITT